MLLFYDYFICLSIAGADDVYTTHDIVSLAAIQVIGYRTLGIHCIYSLYSRSIRIRTYGDIQLACI